MANDIHIDLGARNRASVVFRKVGRDAIKLGAKLQAVSLSVKASVVGMTGALGGMAAAFAGPQVAILGSVVAVGSAVTAFARFDKSIAAVGAISGATGDDLESLRTRAKELGSTTTFSASQAAEGMKLLGQAGFDTQEILAGIGPTLSLAAAGGIELGLAADIASDVGSAFGLTADEIGRVADVLAVTATSANTNVEMMGETFKLAAPLAKAAGQSLEEMSAAAGLLGNSGIKATVAGTDLKNILTALAKDKAQDAFKQMGIAVTDLGGNIRPMLDLMEEFGQKTSNMQGADRLKLFADLFGRSAKSAIVLADVGGGAIDELRGKMANAGGAAKKMASVMQDNLAGVGTKVLSAMEGLAISLVEGMTEPLTEIGDMIAKSLRDGTKFFSENKQLISDFGSNIVTVFKIALPVVTTLSGAMVTMSLEIQSKLKPAFDWMHGMMTDYVIPAWRTLRNLVVDASIAVGNFFGANVLPRVDQEKKAAALGAEKERLRILELMRIEREKMRKIELASNPNLPRLVDVPRSVETDYGKAASAAAGAAQEWLRTVRRGIGDREFNTTGPSQSGELFARQSRLRGSSVGKRNEALEESRKQTRAFERMAKRVERHEGLLERIARATADQLAEARDNEAFQVEVVSR